jgi:hypothetical protein
MSSPLTPLALNARIQAEQHEAKVYQAIGVPLAQALESLVVIFCIAKGYASIGMAALLATTTRCAIQLGASKEKLVADVSMVYDDQKRNLEAEAAAQGGEARRLVVTQ